MKLINNRYLRIRKLAATCLLASYCISAQAVTGARIIVDARPTSGNTTYMASVNSTSNEIKHLWTEYNNMSQDTDIIIGNIPNNYSPPNGADTQYNRDHPSYKGAGLGFNNTFPYGSSGGYRYKRYCSTDVHSYTCTMDVGQQAITHYQTMCNGKQVNFKITAWWGIDPGQIITTVATAIGTIVAPQMLIPSIANGAAYYTTGMTIAELNAHLGSAFAPAVLGITTEMAAGGGFLAFFVYFEIASATATHGALYSDDSYINFSADGNSQITETKSDTSLEHHIVIDDCLEIDAISQDTPYAYNSRSRLVPDKNDALVTTTFMRHIPSSYSAINSCYLTVDDSGTKYSGQCLNNGALSITFLDTSTCTNYNDITNINGVLKCTFNGVPQPTGSYLESCSNVTWNGRTLTAECRSSSEQLVNSSLDSHTCTNLDNVTNQNGVLQCKVSERPTGNYLKFCSNIKWDGVSLKAMCGPFDYRTFPTLNYANDCRNDSTVRYSSNSGQLTCDYIANPL